MQNVFFFNFFFLIFFFFNFFFLNIVKFKFNSDIFYYFLKINKIYLLNYYYIDIKKFFKFFFKFKFLNFFSSIFIYINYYLNNFFLI